MSVASLFTGKPTDLPPRTWLFSPLQYKQLAGILFGLQWVCLGLRREVLLEIDILGRHFGGY